MALVVGMLALSFSGEQTVAGAAVAEATSSDAKPEPVKQDPSLGSVAGVITLSGKPIPPRKIQVTKDSEICSKAPKEVTQVTVGKNGGIAGVVVEITGFKAPADGWKWPKMKTPPELRQKDCRFEPAVLVVPSGTKVKIFNDDPIAHNVNTGSWNVMQPSKSPAIDRELKSRRPIKVGCNIHSWMEAWVYTAQSPHYAVSDKDGKFAIPNIPPGKYRAVAWHPNLKQQRLRLTIESGTPTKQDVVFKSPVK